MEAAPEFWQSPDALNQMHVSVPGGAQVPLSMFAQLRADRDRRSPSITSRSSSPRRSRSTCREGVSLSQATRAIDDALARIGVPTTVRGSFQGSARAFRAVLETQPIAHPRRAADAVHRPRRALRELGPSAHHPVDAAVGGRRRARRADAVPDRVLRHRADRRDHADRHRAEERDHDDRLRARRPSAAATSACARRHLRGLPAALPADPDDDPRRAARRDSARARQGRRRGAPPAARHRDRRRPDPEPAADPLHDADRVSLPRPLPANGCAARFAAPGRYGANVAPPRRMDGDERQPASWRPSRSASALAAAVIAVGCTVGPDYVRPRPTVPPAYKEAQGWPVAQPRDNAAARPLVGALRRPRAQRAGSAGRRQQPDHPAAEARVRQAQALVAQARARSFRRLPATVPRRAGRSGSGRSVGSNSGTGVARTSERELARAGSSISGAASGAASRRARRAASQRRRSRGGDALAAGAGRAELSSCCACRTPRSACCRTASRVRAIAAAHAEPVRGRRRLPRRRRAGGGAAQFDPGPGVRGGREAGAARARHRRADRQAAGRFPHRGRRR